MPQRQELIPVRIALPLADYRVYTSAARILAQIMGAQAPDAAAIIQAQFGGRKPSAIADDHLDSMGWPAKGTPTGRRGG